MQGTLIRNIANVARLYTSSDVNDRLWVAKHVHAPYITLKILAKDSDATVRAAALSNPKYIERTEKESVNVEWNEKDTLANITVKEKFGTFGGGFLFWVMILFGGLIGLKVLQHFGIDLTQSLEYLTP